MTYASTRQAVSCDGKSTSRSRTTGLISPRHVVSRAPSPLGVRVNGVHAAAEGAGSEPSLDYPRVSSPTPRTPLRIRTIPSIPLALLVSTPPSQVQAQSRLRQRYHSPPSVEQSSRGARKGRDWQSGLDTAGTNAFSSTTSIWTKPAGLRREDEDVSLNQGNASKSTIGPITMEHVEEQPTSSRLRSRSSSSSSSTFISATAGGGRIIERSRWAVKVPPSRDE